MKDFKGGDHMEFRGDIGGGGGVSCCQQSTKEELWKIDCQLTANEGGW